jgi:dipeptidyl aminopeptidase/acylaminoacyl peptidase
VPDPKISADPVGSPDSTTSASPYGTWSSPITPQMVAAAHGSIGWVSQTPDAVWWIESRPAEGGRLVLMRDRDGVVEAVTGDDTSVRTRLHEYGGAPWCPVPASPSHAEGACYSEWRDHALYFQPLGSEAAVLLTPQPPFEAGYRYAEPLLVGDEIWATREQHADSSGLAVTRDFVAVPLDGLAAADPRRLRIVGGGERAGGHHFLAGLRLSPDGRRAAWLGWNHPFMPWDETELMVADVVDGALVDAHPIAGGHRDGRAPVPGIAPTHTPGAGIAICQVEWEDENTVLFLSDATGWFELYRARVDKAPRPEPTAITALERELGGPLWQVGLRWFAVLGDGRFAILVHGDPQIFDESDASLTPLPSPGGLPEWSPMLTASGGRIASSADGPTALSRVVSVTDSVVTAHGRAAGLPDLGADPKAWLPMPELIWFDADDGSSVPTYVYPPTNPVARAPEGELPPYVIHIHGGPTGENGTALDLEIAYFTSRGVGVAIPEYGGSGGFGRAWRERLNGRWGVVDVGDAVAVASGLVAAGLADPDRLMIRGGSAGGFTTALALTTDSPFAAGCARYPVVDLVAFADGETHDFESRYLVGLVGELPGDRDVFIRRSPAAHAADVHGPLLIQQGLDDRVCLASVTARFVADAEAAGAPVRYDTYEGEQHGFRRSETVSDAIENEYAFLADAVGIRRTDAPATAAND